MCALADARVGARVSVRMCLCVCKRTSACVGARACAFEEASSRRPTCGCAGVRTGLRACAHYVRPS